MVALPVLAPVRVVIRITKRPRVLHGQTMFHMCERSWTRRNRRRVAGVQIDVLVEGPGPDEGDGGELEG